MIIIKEKQRERERRGRINFSITARKAAHLPFQDREEGVIRNRMYRVYKEREE